MAHPCGDHLRPFDMAGGDRGRHRNMLRPDGALASQHEGDEPARAWTVAASGAELATGGVEAVADEMVRERPPLIEIVQNRKRDALGKEVSIRVGPGGRGMLRKKKKKM